MANRKLGIDVEIKYPTAKQIGDEITKKWKEVKNRDDMELKVKIAPDGNSIRSFKSDIQKYIDNNPIKIKTEWDFVHARKGLKEIDQEFANLKRQMQKGLKVNFDMDAGKGVGLIFENAESKARQLDTTIKNVGGTIRELSKSEASSGFGGFTSAINNANELVETNKKLESSFKQVTEEYVNGELKSTSSTQDKLSALRQIVDVQKEINNLNSAKVGETNSATLEAYAKQIQNLESYMGDLKSDFKEVFGTDPNSEWLVKNTQAVGEMNVELRESKLAQDEVNDGFRRAVTILNEQYEVQKRMEVAGEGEKVALQAKLTALESAYTETMKMKGLEEQMTEVQRTSLDMARQENTMNLEISRQKQNDLDIARQQKEEFRQLKTDRKEIYNIEKEISDLLAKDNYVTDQGNEMSLLNSKEKERLESLKNQLDVKKQAYDMSKQETTVSQETVSKMEQQYDAMTRTNREISEKNAKLEHSKTLYDKIQTSIREQNRLSQKSVSAGDREEATLRDQIRLEEQKQNEIRDSIKSQNLMNDARERELSSMKKVQAEQDELNGKLREASRVDDANAPTKDGNIFGFRIDPMRVASEARQAFQAVHNSVATIDSAMVDIAKVTEAPQAQLDEFSSKIYESASEVGLATEDYLGSVERWVTAGYTLQDSQELGQLSAMGSFVGNISEQDMVDYMSVPLIAFKDTGLEATDVLNAMNEVANKTAIEMDDLGKAYKTSAGTASTAGTSFAELTGLIAGAQEATRRGGDVIGRSLKATDINFAKFYANLTPADETKLNFFENIGVSLEDSKGELRSTYNILEDLSGVWDSLSAEDQSTALFYAGGKQHAATLQGIVTNWNGVAKATDYANQQMQLLDKEGGSAFKEFEVQQDSVQFKTIALKNAWAEFLNTISGGKDGVNSILELLTKIVEMGTKIASNDKAMKVITMIASATLWATATTLVNGFFGAITKGALKSFGDVKGLVGLFKGVGSSGSMIGTGSALSSVATSASKTAVATGKVGGAISMMTGFMGKAIPVIGALGTAYLTAELVAGLFGTSLKEIAIDKLGLFKKATGETTTELEKFTKANEDYSKALAGNDLYSGRLKDVQKIIDKYNDMNKAKKEAEENGEGAFAYSKDEFQILQSDLAMLSEQLGVDLKITYNGEDSILEVVDTAEKLLKQREDKSSNELAVDMNERNKSLNSVNTENIFEREIARIKQETQDQIERSKQSLGNQPEGYMELLYEKEHEAIEKLMADRQKFIQSTDEYAKMAEQRKEAVSQHRDSYQNLINVAPKLDVENMSKQEADGMAKSLLSTAQYTRDIDATYESIVHKISEGSTLTEKEMKMVEGLNSEFVGVNANTSTWADTIGQDAVNALGEVIDKNRESLAVDSQVTDEVIKNLLLQSDVSEEVANDMIARARSSKSEYIQLMGELGETGELALGVSQQALDMYGDKWSVVMGIVQEKIDTLDEEVVTKYNLETEDGLANWDMITAITNDLPESVITKYELIDADGSVNINNIVAMLDGIDDEKVTEWGLKDNSGNFDWEAYARIMSTPEEIATLFGLYKADGSFDIDTLDKLFKGIPDEKMVELGMDIDENGIVSLDEFAESLGKLEGEKVTELLLESSYYEQAVNQAVDNAKEKMREIDETTSVPSIDMRDTPFNEKREGIRRTMEELNFDTSTPSILADSTVFAEKEQNVKFGLRVLGDTSSTSKMKGDNTDAVNKKNETKEAVESLNEKSSTSEMKGNNTDAIDKINAVDEKISKPRGFIVSIGASLSSTFSKAMGLIGLGGSVAINPSVSIGGSSASTPVVGRSFSAGIGNSIPLQSTSLSKSTSSKERKEKPATVDENVWRYWGKELFSGLPIEKSMADLTRSIQRADDNYAKMIPLYRQQLSLIDKQIAYEKSMQKLQQSEMNGIMVQLRRLGFKTSGNKVTNLGISKNMSGEKAEKASNLLSKYKSLYESIDGLNNTMASLKMDKWNTENSIKDAKEKIRLEKIAKELEKIEKTIAKSEAVVKVIGNSLDIFATKLGYISDSDFELKLSVNEEGVNKSAGALGSLIKEFNKLSKQAIGDPDNAEKMLSHLDSLKDSILGNADAVLEYKEAMKQIEIDRFVSDFDLFSETMDKNIGRLEANIENLKSGLLSGQSMGDLYSSSFVSFDPQRKKGIEKSYQDRLNLEEKLNTALDTFAKKNVDRAKKVANSTLQIESKKYASLLQMQKDYSNGKVSTPTISNVSTGIGITTVQKTGKDKEYQAWLSKLGKINSSYEKAYANMVKKFDVAMKNAKNASEKELITNDMIISQLKLQESMYKDIISVNNMAIANAKKMMTDSSLTTEQIEALKAEIEKYEEANINAQDAIKDSVTSRYDLEMDLIDKTLDKAKEYSDELGKMLDIAEAVGSSDEVMAKMYEAIHKGKLNEFSQSAEVLKKLNAEQAKLAEGSYEWGILADKIKDVEKNMSDLTLEILNSNKDILDNELDRIKKSSEKSSLNGSTLEAFKKYRDTWVSGVEKEIELEKLRLRLASTEDKSLQAKLEMLDRQEAISKSELDYMDKQLSVIELQEKLNNINGQKNVQTLGKDADGNWQWQYVADQTEYDKTNQELQDAQIELEKYKEEQKVAYIEEMNDIISKVKDGDYSSEEELVADIAKIKDVFDGVIAGDVDLYDTNAILEAYRKYTSGNQDIISGQTGGITDNYSQLLESVGSQFEKSFLTIGAELGKIIGEELKNALKSPSSKSSQGGNVYEIQKQYLEFPNVKDANGIEEVFKDLPQFVKQMDTSK